MKTIHFSLFLFSNFLFFQLNNSFAQCAPPTAKVDLDISNIRARINIGTVWLNCDTPSTYSYNIPKGSGKNSLSAGALWIGGIDPGGNVRVAAQTYCQSGPAFWPGPLDTTNASVNSSVCQSFDRFWKINRQDVVNFIGGGTATADMISYPGNLAPFYDNNGDGLYNTNDGDYPLFDYLNPSTSCGECRNCNTLHGDQAIWWVMNDAGNTSSLPGNGGAIGLEIQCQAFAYLSNDDDINNATFYQYKMINRNPTMTISETYFGQWVDPALGNDSDDYVGCDVGRGMGYCYNGDDDDDGPLGYGTHPPAVGVDFLKGPWADLGDGRDNNRDSCIDCTWYKMKNGQDTVITDSSFIVDGCDTVYGREQIIMSKFLVYNDDLSTIGNPVTAADYYNYLKGVWKDGKKLTYGCNGHGCGGPLSDTCDFMYPGTSDPYNWGTQGKPEAPWDELLSGNPPGDRRFLMSTGPFTLVPGAVHCITIAVPWARDTTGPVAGGAQRSLDKLKLVDDKLQRLADSCFNIATFVGVQSITKTEAAVYPNPAGDYLTIRLSQYLKDASVTIYNATGQLIKMQSHFSGKELTIPCKDLPSGIYFYQINSTSANNLTGKFLKQ